MKQLDYKISLKIYDDFLSSTTLDRLQKILCRYEIYKMSMNVPGHVVECGVYKGSGIYTWAKLRAILKPNSHQKIVGFDFLETPHKSKSKFKDDRNILKSYSEKTVSKESILSNLARLGEKNIDLIEGNATVTTRGFAKENLGFRISILYLDIDGYEATVSCLENLFPLVSPGGIVVLDEYAIPGYGESNAVDDFFKKTKVRMNSFPWAYTPSAYIIK